MSITLTYPIRETHDNLALKKDRTVVSLLPYSQYSHHHYR